MLNSRAMTTHALLSAPSRGILIPGLQSAQGNVVSRLPLTGLRMPRVDFDSLVREQLSLAVRKRVDKVASTPIERRILDFVEGPWAPSARDLPERRKIIGSGAIAEPFRKPVDNLRQYLSWRERKQAVAKSERRWSMSEWSSMYEYSVPVRNLAPALDGFTILHLSDVHFLGSCQRAQQELGNLACYLERGERRIDTILLSGDVITRSPDDLDREALRQLRRLTEVCPQAFMVYGNHDYHGHTPALISRELERVGFHDINNHRVTLTVDGAPLNVFGVDDAYFGRPDAPSAVRQDQTNILVTHNLDAIRGNFPEHFDLILSGHTHWGEVRFVNGSDLMRLWGYTDNINRQTKHWDVLSERTLSYVHPGLARYYVPFRGLRHPPGFVLHTLRPAMREPRQ